MKLRPGAPLGLALAFDDTMPAAPAGRVVMAGGVAQLEWSPDVIRSGLPVAPLLYPPEPGLHAARSRSFGGLHGFLGRIDIHRSQIMAAARWTKPVKWMMRRS